jgi:crossover junction endodeoxyribonuclease RusA
MTSFEFVRLGIPCTVQTRNKSRLDNYRRDVRRAATARWSGNIAPLAVPVSVTINYYYTSDALDVDNIIKPILDQLKGLVYQDDLQVVKVVSQKSLVRTEGIAPRDASSVLTDGLRSRDDFLHILVEWE